METLPFTNADSPNKVIGKLFEGFPIQPGRSSAVVVLMGFLLIVVILIVFNLSKANNISKTVIPSNKESEELAIEQYLLTKEKDAYFRSPGSKFFCAVEILWEQPLNDGEKIVYALNNCGSVLLIDGDLRGESGGGGFPLFKMEYKNNKWLVTDADKRTVSPEEPITQDWVKDAEKKVPENIKATMCFANNRFSTKGVITKAAEYFKVKLPEYPLNPCNTNYDCASDSICVLKGDHSNQGPNTCVKKCDTNSDCGIAHTCRYQCVNGENVCPDTAKKICIPDLLHRDVQKDPNGFIE